MDGELDKKIEQISQLLGKENVPDNLKELVTILAASLEGKKDTRGKNVSPGGDSAEKSSAGDAAAKPTAADTDEKPPAADTAKKPPAAEAAENAEIQETARKALDRLNIGNDPRINLLYAIRPFMNVRRQKKIGDCIQLLQVAGLSRLLDESEK